MDDGNNGGRCYINIKGMKTNLLSSNTSGCFTLMWVTAATGETLLLGTDTNQMDDGTMEVSVTLT